MCSGWGVDKRPVFAYYRKRYKERLGTKGVPFRNPKERDCHWLKAVPGGRLGKCIRELVRRTPRGRPSGGTVAGHGSSRYLPKEEDREAVFQ